MTDQPSPEEPKSAAEAWREVGDQFETLGKSVASAFRSAWQNEETRQHVSTIQTGLESMANQVRQAVEDTAKSPEAQQFQQEVEQAASSARSALSKAAAELSSLLNRLADSAAGTAEGDDEPR